MATVVREPVNRKASRRRGGELSLCPFPHPEATFPPPPDGKVLVAKVSLACFAQSFFPNVSGRARVSPSCKHYHLSVHPFSNFLKGRKTIPCK